MKKEIITIAGRPGSGKSSTARGVSKELEYDHFSSGDLFRQIAKEHGCSVKELNIKAETQPEIDFEVDEKLRNIGKTKDKLVIDSRTAFHWIPNSFKVYLQLDEDTAAKRTFQHIQEEGRESQIAKSVTDVYKQTLERYRSENKRYKDLYDLNPERLEQYDLVIDTSQHSLLEVTAIIIETYKQWLKEEE